MKRFLAAAALVFGISVHAQTLTPDSYAVYDTVLKTQFEYAPANPGGRIVEGRIFSMPPDLDCASSVSNDLSPHVTVDGPHGLNAEWRQVLADFDAHCHVEAELDAAKFQSKVQLVDHAAFERLRAGLPAGVTDADAIVRFSQVYFDVHHKLALVQIDPWFGAQRRSLSWLVLELKPSGWVVVPTINFVKVSP